MWSYGDIIIFLSETLRFWGDTTVPLWKPVSQLEPIRGGMMVVGCSIALGLHRCGLTWENCEDLSGWYGHSGWLRIIAGQNRTEQDGTDGGGSGQEVTRGNGLVMDFLLGTVWMKMLWCDPKVSNHTGHPRIFDEEGDMTMESMELWEIPPFFLYLRLLLLNMILWFN